jgi:DinB family protein
MMKITTVLLTTGLALTPALAAAQVPTFKPSPNPVSDAVRTMLARDSTRLIAAAELLPPDKYGYQPTPAQMTFAQLVVHVVQTNIALCSTLSATPSPMAPADLKALTGVDAKDALVAALKKSFAYCTESIDKLRDSELADEASMFGRPTGQSRGGALVTIATDWADHYSTAASYLRLNGLLPPSAQPRK